MGEVHAPFTLKGTVVHVELTNGQKAELREADSVSRKERNDLLAKFPSQATKIGPDGKLVAGQVDFAAGIAAEDEILVFLIESWTLPYPIPREDRTSLDVMSAIDADILEAASKGFMEELMPSTQATPTQPPSTT